jgi:hypothetical protein
MFAAVAGVLAVAGIGSAQSPPPGYLPQIPIAGPVVPASGTSPAATAGGVIQQPAVPFGQYGPGCNSGCGNWKSDAGFIWGSCKSFFDPCGPKGCGGGGLCGGGLFRNRQNCAAHPMAVPYGTGYNGCCYDSYLNH